MLRIGESVKVRSFSKIYLAKSKSAGNGSCVMKKRRKLARILFFLMFYCHPQPQVGRKGRDSRGIAWIGRACGRESLWKGERE